MSEPAPQPTPPGRESNGRFAAGNPGGPGGARRRASELRQAAQEAIEPDHVKMLMKRALRMALEGNLTALKFVVEQSCGKALDLSAETEPSGFSLPKLATVEDCAAALDKLGAAVTARTIDLATAKVLQDIVHSRVKAIEVTKLEQQLVELEKMAATVDLGAQRR